jgi:glyoxylase-like metal-dependent hydrolase (beta-lactamase superfamily II)
VSRRPSDHAIPERQLGERLFAVAPDVFRIALPTDFPVGDVNAYLLDGPEPTLIDAGVAGERTQACLEQALGALGRSVRELRRVLLSHAHVDHAGGARAIRDRSGAEVVLHPRGHERLRDVQADTERSAPWFAAFFARAGFDAPTIARHGELSRKFVPYSDPCPVLRGCVGGDRIGLGAERSLRVHESFGHTSNHVAYELEGTGLLFTGDALLPHISSNPTLEPPAAEDREKPRPLVLYQESLGRLGRLDVSVACPGHGRPFTDVAGRAAELLAHQLQRCEQVVELLAESGPATVKELSLGLFGRVRLWELYLTVSEAQAAVELLEHQGRVRRLREADVDRYVLV